MDLGFKEWVDKARTFRISDVMRARKLELPGRNGKLAGPCPNCGGEDRFAVETDRDLFNCRGCGAKGQGGISFVKFLDGSNFLQAVESITGEPPPKGEKQPAKKKSAKRLGPKEAEYLYTDELENELYQVERYRDPKTFRQRKRSGDGWIYNLNGVRLVPYRLPDLLEAVATDQIVYIVEGEKDVNNAFNLGVVATCGAMGVAGKSHWEKGQYDEFFRNADVVIIPDNDPDQKKGHALGRAIGNRLLAVAERVRWLKLPAGKDISEWIEQGGTREALDKLVDETAREFVNVTDDQEQQSASATDLPLPAIMPKSEFIKGFIPPDYIVDGILQRRFIYSLTGQTGHAKTAVALLMAQLVSCVDANVMFGRHRVEKGRVIYFVGENPDDVRMRVIGTDSIRTDNPKADNIYFIPGIFNIGDMMKTLEADAKENGEPALIIIDTSAAYFLGDEEMSNTQMGNYARMLRRLTTLPGGPCVLVLCHPIKHVNEPSQLLPRGGGAYLAEVDGNLTLWRSNDEMVTLDHYGKFRGPGFQPMSFRLESINDAEPLKDKKGRPISTVHAVAITQSEEDRSGDDQVGDENAVIMAMLNDLSGSASSWATIIGWMSGRDNQEPNKKKVNRILERLSKEGNQKDRLVTKNRNRWVLTEKGKETARAAALARDQDRIAKESTEAAKQMDMGI